MTMPLSSLPGGSESVLVVAGDKSIADTLRDSLVVLGYSVHVTDDSSQLAGLLGSRKFELVVLDSSADTSATPARLAAAICRKYPAVAALLVLGSDAPESGSAGQSPILLKPFTLKDLAVLARRALDGELGE
jgi:DNA-binding NtrC family response regulator